MRQSRERRERRDRERERAREREIEIPFLVGMGRAQATAYRAQAAFVEGLRAIIGIDVRCHLLLRISWRTTVSRFLRDPGCLLCAAPTSGIFAAPRLESQYNNSMVTGSSRDSRKEQTAGRSGAGGQTDVMSATPPVESSGPAGLGSYIGKGLLVCMLTHLRRYGCEELSNACSMRQVKLVDASERKGLLVSVDPQTGAAALFVQVCCMLVYSL